MTVLKLCRHCGRSKVNRPRGLCWSCYYSPGLRDRYPSTSKYARQGIGHKASGTLPTPTTMPPGTPQKLAVLRQRAAAGLQLWHPLDATH